MSESEVHSWLKSLSPGMKLERFSPNFESRGFRSRRSLRYVKNDDLDTFFDSPDKPLLAEKRVLEAELQKLKEDSTPSRQQSEPSKLQPKRLNWMQGGENANLSLGDQQSNARQSVMSQPSQHSQSKTSPLDRRAVEHSENLQVLAVQVESAKQQLEYKRKTIENMETKKAANPKHVQCVM